jgi:hypothetical protein
MNRKVQLSFSLGLFCTIFVLRNSSLAYEGDSIIETKCRIFQGQTNREYSNYTVRDEPLIYSFYVDRSYFQDAHVSQYGKTIRNINSLDSRFDETDSSYYFS